jgi:hypothetical protein
MISWPVSSFGVSAAQGAKCKFKDGLDNRSAIVRRKRDDQFFNIVSAAFKRPEVDIIACPGPAR